MSKSVQQRANAAIQLFEALGCPYLAQAVRKALVGAPKLVELSPDEFALRFGGEGSSNE